MIVHDQIPFLSFVFHLFFARPPARGWGGVKREERASNERATSGKFFMGGRGKTRGADEERASDELEVFLLWVGIFDYTKSPISDLESIFSLIKKRKFVPK